MNEQINSVSVRPEVIAALEELAKVDAAAMFWREKIRLMPMSDDIIRSLTIEEQVQLSNIRIRVTNNLEAAQ